MPTPRFLTLADVADILNVSWRQVYALVRRKELLAIQIGGRGQWRVETAELERFIAQKYDEARAGTVPDEADVEAEVASRDE
jgi:excisionase family DNA binding protein